MNSLTIEQQAQKLRDLVYDVRTALCRPLEEGETSSESIVGQFIKTDILTDHEKTQRLRDIWEATGEILDIMDGRWNRHSLPEIHHPHICEQKVFCLKET